MKNLSILLLLVFSALTLSCQTIDSTRMVPVMEEDSNYYVNLCYGDTLDVGFLDSGVYTWIISGETQPISGDRLYVLLEPGAWTVSVDNPSWGDSYEFRVRAGDKPSIRINDIGPLCSGDCSSLTFGTQFSTIYCDTIFQEQVTTLGVSDMVFLPDGLDCGNGCSYISSVQFTGFSPNAVLTNANDILYCMVDIEHSYIGDIWISLTCPNGQRASLLKKYGTGSSGSCYSQIPASSIGWNGAGTSYARFGVANTNDNSLNKCDPLTNPPGTCWQYYWSNNPQSTYVNNQYVYTGATGSVGVPSGFYHPDDNFSALVGCPLNGNWSIQVMDGWSIDNGWLCGWELALNPDLIPQDWSFDQYITDVWSDVGTDYICPDSSGTYNLYIGDNLGCIYDTVTDILVVQRPVVELGQDMALCTGDLIWLEAPDSCDSYWWNTGETSQSIPVISFGDYYVLASNEDYGITCYGSDTVRLNFFPSPNITLTIENNIGCAPLEVQLKAEEEFSVLYIWKDGQIIGTTNGYNSIILDNAGIYSIEMVCTNEYGCVDTVWYNDCIEVLPGANSEFEWQTNGLHVDFVNNSTEGSYLWYFDYINSSQEESPSFDFQHPGDYPVALWVENVFGCNDSTMHIVTCELPLVFPNVITPNGDGKNDVFAIENLIVPQNNLIPRGNELYIYNRWGKQIYYKRNYDTYALDGEIYEGENAWPNKPISGGTYYYTFECYGPKRQSFNGTITVIK